MRRVNLRVSFQRLTLMLLAAGVSLYIQVPIIGKPYFFLTGIALCVSLCALIKRSSISWDELIVLGVSSLLLFVLVEKIFLSADPAAHLQVFNLLLLPLSFLSLRGMSDPTLAVRYVKASYHFAFLAFTVELIYRLLNPSFGGRVVDPGEVEGGTFYLYKISSLMYTNSNGVGMHALFMLAFLYALYGPWTRKNLAVLKQHGLTGHFFLYAFLGLFIFTVGSLSRAAVLVFLAMSLLYYMFSNFRRLQFSLILLLLFLTPVAFFTVSLVVDFFAGDASFSTKFQILNNLIKYLREASVLQIMFGNNFDYPLDIYPKFVGFFGHTHYFDIIFRLGFFYGGLYLLLFVFLAVKLRWRGALFLLSFVTLGLSNIRIFGHYLFFYMGMGLALPYMILSMERNYLLKKSLCYQRYVYQIPPR